LGISEMNHSEVGAATWEGGQNSGGQIEEERESGNWKYKGEAFLRTHRVLRVWDVIQEGKGDFEKPRKGGTLSIFRLRKNEKRQSKGAGGGNIKIRVEGGVGKKACGPEPVPLTKNGTFLPAFRETEFGWGRGSGRGRERQ